MSVAISNFLSSQLKADSTTCIVDGVKVPSTITSCEAEYNCIRDRVALSDQSHYSKFVVKGSDSIDFLSFVNLPDIARLPIGKTASSFMLNEDGSVFCECYIVSSGDSYMILAEGRDRETVAEYLTQHSQTFDVEIRNVSDDYAFLELDGPYAWEVLKDIVGVKILGLRYLETLDNQLIGGAKVQIIRAGKTGEFGYCLVVPAAEASNCVEAILKAGERYQMLAVGFKALDLCRMENRFPNMRLDCSNVANPFEMNCRVMFDREKDNHLGRDAMESLLESGPAKRIIAIVADDDADSIFNLGQAIALEGKQVGEVVNSGYSYMLKKSIGLALISNELAYVGLTFEVGDENRSVKTVSAPFVYNKSLEIRPQEHSFHAK